MIWGGDWWRCFLGVFAIFLAGVCSAGELDATRATAKDQKTEPLTLLTYNVLANARQADARLPALLKILRESHADIIALQEVTPWFLARLQQEKWVRPYHVRRVNGKPQAAAGLYILSRYHVESFTVIDLPSRQNRKGLLVRFTVGGHRIAIATCHLDSYLDAGVTRAAQLKKIFAQMKNVDTAVVLGDFNFGDDEKPETAAIPAAYADAWRTVHPEAAGYTWDIERSKMAKAGSFPKEKSRRLDRILVRSERWTFASSKIIGSDPVSLKTTTNLFPSDHFGVQATLTRKSQTVTKNTK